MYIKSGRPALYDLDDDGEATGTVHYFCSLDCRAAFDSRRRCRQKHAEGLDDDWLNTSQCEVCGEDLR